MSYKLLDRIRGLYRTAFEKITVALFLALVTTVVLFVFRAILLGWIGIGVIMLFCILWARSLQEECVIFSLKNHGGYVHDRHVIDQFSPKAVSRLQKKNIIEIHKEKVTLVNPQQRCAFDKFRGKSR